MCFIFVFLNTHSFLCKWVNILQQKNHTPLWNYRTMCHVEGIFFEPNNIFLIFQVLFQQWNTFSIEINEFWITNQSQWVCVACLYILTRTGNWNFQRGKFSLFNSWRNQSQYSKLYNLNTGCVLRRTLSKINLSIN